MIIFFIFGLLIGGLAVIFALQNTAIITVTFMSWQLTGSLALILSLAIVAGALTILLILLPDTIKNHFRFKTLKKENADLEEQLRKQKELTVFAKKVPPTEAEIEALERSAVVDPHNTI